MWYARGGHSGVTCVGWEETAQQSRFIEDAVVENLDVKLRFEDFALEWLMFTAGSGSDRRCEPRLEKKIVFRLTLFAHWQLFQGL